LEYFTPGQDAAALVALAYDMGHQTQAPSGQHHGHGHRRNISASSSCSSSSLDKELPPAPPPVPPKDAMIAHPLPDEMFLPWENLISTIPEDTYLPNNDPMQFSDFYPTDLDMGMDIDLHGL
jgi:hypothetical protein